jgi:hypothetical protein
VKSDLRVNKPHNVNDQPIVSMVAINKVVNILAMNCFIIFKGQGILKGEVSLYHCLLFDWFGLVCLANKNKNCQLSYG